MLPSLAFGFAAIFSAAFFLFLERLPPLRSCGFSSIIIDCGFLSRGPLLIPVKMFDTQNNDETFQGDFKPLTPEKLTPGMFLGKEKNYRLEKFLGAGGMGYAWLAAEIEDGVELRKVVCKVLPAMVQREKAEMEKVLKTFHLVQPLSHPNICPIYGLKSDPVCGYFFVMGYGDGGTLGDWLLRQPNPENGLPVSKVAEVLRPVALALDHAHEMGIIHRDVKPHNILFVTRGGRMIP